MASNLKSAHTTHSQASTSRGSQARTPVCQRPRLMRSSATAPCLATSNASRNDLASLHPASKASTLLSRMASYSLNRQSRDLRISSNSCQSKSPGRHSRLSHNDDESFEEGKQNLCLNRIGHG